MYARDILSRPVVTVRPETPLHETISLLTENAGPDWPHRNHAEEKGSL
ncbi:hypothetical protein [Nocardia anaemiae]|nr:hypothetical protein [Nocardia anaemiae]